MRLMWPLDTPWEGTHSDWWMADALSSKIIKGVKGGKELFNQQCLIYSHLTNAISQAKVRLPSWQHGGSELQACPKETA